MQSAADPQHCRVAGPGVTKAVAGQRAELVVEVGARAAGRKPVQTLTAGAVRAAEDSLCGGVQPRGAQSAAGAAGGAWLPLNQHSALTAVAPRPADLCPRPATTPAASG